MILLALLFWTVDRLEPPWAVLVPDEGETVEVLITTLPEGTREGDRLAGVAGPRINDGGAAAAQVAQRVARLTADDDGEALVLGTATPGSSTGGAPTALASRAAPRHGAAMGDRRQDHYARRAQAEGFRARSIYKLQEIHRRVTLFRRGQRVLDLGCAPGSWAQFAASQVGPSGQVVGIDLQAVPPIAPHVHLIQGDIYATPPEVLLEGGRPFDIVMSDMAPSTSGARFTDHVRSIELCTRALELADLVLRPGGAFVCKAFEGSELNDFVAQVKARYRTVRRIKPEATRDESVELFVVGQDRKEGG